jgi:phage gp29-like protein
MAKRRSPSNQLETRPDRLPEYGELISVMVNETANYLNDYIRGWVGSIPNNGIVLNKDRVLNTQSYQELAWYPLYAEVERDPHVEAVMGSAKLDVAGIPWDVDPWLKGSEKKPSTRNQAIADFIKDALLNSGPADDSEGIVWALPQHLYEMMGALGMGYSVGEILYNRPDPIKGVTIRDILSRDPRRFQFDVLDRSLKLRTIEAPYFGISLPKKKFIVHRCSAKNSNPFGDALDQSLYWMWLFKKTGIKFWLQHLQTAAAPIPLVKHPASANKELKDQALEIAKMLRGGAYGRIPDNFEVIWAESKNALSATEGYNMFIRMCDDQMSKCVNGQTLTTEASSSTGTGTHAQGKIHQGTMNQRVVFRARGLQATINSTLVKWLVGFNFANVDGYPQFRFDLEDPEDLVQESQIIKNLSDTGQFEFDPLEIGEKFNYTIKKKEAKPLELGKPALPEGEPEKPIEEPTDATS